MVLAMTSDLTGKTAVVTGVAHGIGSGIAAALREAGADVPKHSHGWSVAASALSCR